MQVARGKFISGAKVLAVLPSVSQPRRVYYELYENEDRQKTSGAAVVNKNRNTAFWKSVFLEWS